MPEHALPQSVKIMVLILNSGGASGSEKLKQSKLTFKS